MAINEQDREDLLRDGRAMAVRGESMINGVIVVVGFRGDQQMSVYCGADPVFQFNAQRQLRRVYFDGQRYAANGGRLVHLRRESKGGRVQFDPQAICVETQQTILTNLKSWLVAIGEHVTEEQAEWKVAEGANVAFVMQLESALQALSSDVEIAQQPNQ